MGAKIARWLLFTVLFSLIPLGVDFLAEAARTNGEVSISSIGRHGELYLLASAMCAVGLGELTGISSKYLIAKLLAGGAAMIVIGAATALYTISASDAATALAQQAGSQPAVTQSFAHNVISYSYLMFIFACIASTSCIALSEVK